VGFAALPWIARRPGRRRAALFGALGLSAAVSATAALEGEDGSVAAILPLVVIASHTVYGAQFLRGLATPRLSR
jgi:hypothetical protein